MFEAGSCSARLVKSSTRFPVLRTANLNRVLFLEEKHQLAKSSVVNVSGPRYESSKNPDWWKLVGIFVVLVWQMSAGRNGKTRGWAC
jgi:hypothetical protein